MAVGSETKWINVFVLTGALSLHKILLAFALGNLDLIKCKVSFDMTACLAV